MKNKESLIAAIVEKLADAPDDILIFIYFYLIR